MIRRRDGSRIASIKKGFAACVADAGLTDVHPHDLRRTFGSWLVQSGVGIERVSELLRHGSVAITASVYAHLRPDDLASAAAILDCPKSQRATAHLHTDLHTGPEEDEPGAKSGYLERQRRRVAAAADKGRDVTLDVTLP